MLRLFVKSANKVTFFHKWTQVLHFVLNVRKIAKHALNL